MLFDNQLADKKPEHKYRYASRYRVGFWVKLHAAECMVT